MSPEHWRHLSAKDIADAARITGNYQLTGVTQLSAAEIEDAVNNGAATKNSQFDETKVWIGPDNGDGTRTVILDDIIKTDL